LHKSSFHPKHTFKGILKSQLLRFKRLSSSFENYDRTCKILFKVLQNRGYSRSLLRKMKRDMWLTDENLTRKDTTGLDNCIPIVIPYSLTGSALAKNWKLLIRNNSRFQDIRLITAFCNSRNLGSKLVRSSLTASSSLPVARLQTTSHPADQPGMHKCTNRRCKACKLYIIDDVKFKSFYNKRIFDIKHSLSCRSFNVIYLISCKRCGMQYVGQTGRALGDRINDHLSNIRTVKSTPVALHFNLQDHSIEDFQISAIEQIPDSSLQHRLIKESTWQNLLQTAYPLGINNLKPYYLD
jgi:GIY-YIG catalytic domain